MKINITTIIFFILMIFTFIAIFIFSSQDAKKSSLTSKEFVKKVIEIIPFTKSLNNIQKKQIIENSQFFIRKLAHFSIYTLAGFCIIGFFSTLKKIKKKNIVYLTLIIGILYAISDEIHQMYSDGRTPKFLDIIIDSIGILCGIIIFYGIQKMIKKMNKKIVF